jgi:hypothetical protein
VVLIQLFMVFPSGFGGAAFSTGTVRRTTPFTRGPVDPFPGPITDRNQR